MIIGLSGYARSGKDEVAKILVEKYGYKRMAFADPIREFVLKVNPILEDGHRIRELVEEFGWDVAKAKPETRRLLQETGVVARELFGQEFWVEQLIKHIGYETDIVIPDVRFKNEVSMIRQLEGKVFRVIRTGVKPVNAHVSETELDGAYFESYIPNEGTLEDLEAYVVNLMRPHANQIV